MFWRVRSVMHCFSVVLSDWSSEVVVVVYSADGSAYLDKGKIRRDKGKIPEALLVSQTRQLHTD